MSILSNIANELLRLIYPPHCLICGEPLNSAGDHHICTKCFSTIPYTYFWSDHDNAMALHARSMQSFVEEASAMLHFNKTSRPLIHRLKYHGEWQTAEYLGQLLGSYLSTCELYASVDVVIPVPIHPLRRLGRTYNQSEYIARGVASALGVTTNFHSLYRRHYTSAQALKPRQERWDNFDNIFAVRKPNALQNKHILIVDDVYTSGATIFSCIDALHSALPLSKISIATLATGKQKIAFPQRE